MAGKKEKVVPFEDPEAKEPAKPKEPIKKKSKRTLAVKFTDAELLKIGKNLAEAQENLNSLENQKKNVVAQFTAKLAAVEADIGLLTNNIRSGYEYRSVPVTEVLHQPRQGRKEIIRDDTGEVTGEEPMTEADWQPELLEAKQEKERQEQEAKEKEAKAEAAETK